MQKSLKNKELQEVLNPPNEALEEKTFGDRTFREGDKVMQIRNNYQLEWEIRGKYGIAVEKGVGVFNGDMGIVEEINTFCGDSDGCFRGKPVCGILL